MNGFNMFRQQWLVCCTEVTQFTRVLLDIIVNSLNMFPQGALVRSLQVALVAREFLDIVVNSLDVMLQCRLARCLVVTLWTRKWVVNFLHVALHNLLGPDLVIHCEAI